MAFELPADAPLRYQADGLGVVTRHADAGGVHPAQAKHDVGVAALGQPAQRLQEIAAVGGDAPHLQLRVRARRHRRHALAQLVRHARRAAVEADDDVAEAQPRLSGRTVGGRLEDERAVGVGETERQRQRQLQRIHLHAEPALLRVLGLAADLHRHLDEAALRLRRRRLAGRRYCRRGGSAGGGTTGGCCAADLAGGGVAGAGRCGMRTMSMPESATLCSSDASAWMAGIGRPGVRASADGAAWTARTATIVTARETATPARQLMNPFPAASRARICRRLLRSLRGGAAEGVRSGGGHARDSALVPTAPASPGSAPWTARGAGLSPAVAGLPGGVAAVLGAARLTAGCAAGGLLAPSSARHGQRRHRLGSRGLGCRRARRGAFFPLDQPAGLRPTWPARRMAQHPPGLRCCRALCPARSRAARSGRAARRPPWEAMA